MCAAVVNGLNHMAASNRGNIDITLTNKNVWDASELCATSLSRVLRALRACGIPNWRFEVASNDDDADERDDIW